MPCGTTAPTMKKLLITIGLTIILLTIGISIAEAYQINPDYAPINTPYNQGAGGAEINTIVVLQLIAGALLYFAAPLGVIFITMTAWTLITEGSDTEKYEQAKKHLTWTIIGLILIILSYSLVKFTIDFVIEAAEKTEPVPGRESPAEQPSSINDLGIDFSPESQRPGSTQPAPSPAPAPQPERGIEEELGIDL